MKPRMMSKPAMDHLFDHVLDGHAKSFEGIRNLKDMHLIDDQEYVELLTKNTERLIDRIKEFKIVHRIVSIGFAVLFSYTQISCDDMDMRRARRLKLRRRQEVENVVYL